MYFLGSSDEELLFCVGEHHHEDVPFQKAEMRAIRLIDQAVQLHPDLTCSQVSDKGLGMPHGMIASEVSKKFANKDYLNRIIQRQKKKNLGDDLGILALSHAEDELTKQQHLIESNGML